VSAEFSWFILELRKDRLTNSAIGDVDLLAGRLEWTNPEQFEALRQKEMKQARAGTHPNNLAFLAALELASAGGIKWPPSTAWLAAVEAKCAYLNPQAPSISAENLKSTKGSVKKVAHMQEQLKSLLELGFNRVALLDVIANPPVSGPDGQAWLNAAAVAADSKRAMSRILERRLPLDSPAGHYVWSVGAVVGGHEGMRGSISIEELKVVRDNPLPSLDTQVSDRRHEVEKHLRNILTPLPKPLNLSLRVVFTDCQACGQIHWERSGCSR